MSEKRFEKSMNSEKHIQSDLKDSGISRTSQWREALDLGTLLEGEKRIESDYRDFEKLLVYLGEEKKIEEKEKIKKFKETKDSIEKLEILSLMSLGDAIVSVRDYSTAEGSSRYLANRLDFYQKLIQGKATKRQTKSQRDEKKHEYVQAEKESLIDAAHVSPEAVRLGLLRDIEFAAMIGTPELGVYKIVDKRLKDKKIILSLF